MLNCTAQPEHMPRAPRPHRASCLGNEGCAAFKCLVHLWEWLDPPTLITSNSMDTKKDQPTIQQPLQQRSVPHLHANPPPTLATRLNSPQPGQLPTNGIVHQLLMQSPGYQQHSSTISQDAQTPLLENHHELYGTQHLSDYVKRRQYGTGDGENIYSPQTPQSPQTQLPINYAYNVRAEANAVPLGYNVDVHNAYLLRNPPKDQNQIYQNHQGVYRTPEIENGNNSYIPYTNRPQALAPSNTEMLKQQYNEIQQMRLQQQMHYQNRAQMQQQQIFAHRQLLLQHMHGVQPPPNLRQHRELLQPKEAKVNRNKKLYEMSSGKEDLYGQDQFYGKDISYEKYQYNRKDRSNSQEQNNFMEQTVSKEGEPLKQGEPLKLESRERERYQAQGQPISPLISKSPESTSPSIKSPSENRRSSGGTQALKSPIAQRPASAPVTMSGWLYKQGSDGLKVWRKRWFVLSEYCLFYYKSQEEDKLLGSVLLPSYEVRACGAEERVSRRHAFKCEHANMRTLLLAATDEALMQAWLRALTCAALMQEGSVREPVNSSQEEVRQYGRENDNEMSEEDGSPGHTYANAPPKPRRSNDGYNSPSPERYESNYDLLRKPQSIYNQSIQTPTRENIYDDEQPKENYIDPLPVQTYQTKYKLAPDATLAETPEKSRSYLQKHQKNQFVNREDARSPKYFDDVNKSVHHRTEQLPHEGITERSQGSRQLPDQSMLRDLTNWNTYGSQNQDTETAYKRTTVESAYGSVGESYKSANNDNFSEIRQNQMDIRSYNIQMMNTENDNSSYYNTSHNTSDRIERRTPDAYGRSAIVPDCNSNAKSSDYEDIYPKYPAGNEYRSSYKAVDPVNEEKITSQNEEGYKQTTYERNLKSPTQGVHYVPSVLRRTKAQSVLRPHSADFLQHSAERGTRAPAPAPSRCPPASRPKSSLDIHSYHDPSSDGYYSEESYAAKMRQSAQYLHSGGAHAANAARFNTPLPLLDSNNEKLYSTSDSFVTNDTSRGDVRTAVNTSNYIDKDNVSYDSSKYADSSSLNSNWTLRDNRNLTLENDSCNRSDRATGNSLKARDDALGGECFVRSASARLPSDVQECNKDDEKKVHQREESMKRLLEWKQRMLQSPLTRKSTPAALTLAALTPAVHPPATLNPATHPPAALNLARSLHSALPHQEQTADFVLSRPSEQAGRPRDSLLTPSAPSTISPRHTQIPTDLCKDLPQTTFDITKPSSNGNVEHADTLCKTENERFKHQIPSNNELDTSESKTTNPSEKNNPKSEQLGTKLSIENLHLDNHRIRQIEKAEMPIDLCNEECNDVSNSDNVSITTLVKPMQKLDILQEKRYPKKDYEIIVSQSLKNEENREEHTDQKEITMDNQGESTTDMEYTDDDLDEVLMNSDEEKLSAKDEDRKVNKRGSQNENRMSSEDNNSDSRTVTEPITRAETRISNITTTTAVLLPHEDHYLPMTPRKAPPTVNTFNSFTSVFEAGYTGGHEDNNYVEMSQGFAVDNVFGHDAYEVVCVNNNGRVEPVYMELTTPDQLQDIVSNVQNAPEPPEPNQKDTRSSYCNLSESSAMDKSTLKRGDKPMRNEALRSPLPDILMNSNNNILISDSSDADDEASKDFSLDMPFSRFSLSDTFRPASYYLGSSRTLLDLPDDSDSELVFPPPVPASSPPAEDIDSIMTMVQKQQDEKSSTPGVFADEFEHSKYDTIKRKTTSLMIYGSTPSVHDTLFRGEKIRRSRASLTNDSQIKENIESFPSSNNLLFKPCSSADTESVLSYNADRCSSRMSLDSDLSSKWMIDSTTSNISSAGIMSLNFASVSSPGEELQRISKRRPLADESILEEDKYLGDSQLRDSNMPEVDGSSNENLVVPYGVMKLDREGYYNQRIAAMREERQYENINIQDSIKKIHLRSVSSPVTSSSTPPFRPVGSCSMSSSTTNMQKVMPENLQTFDNDGYCEQLFSVSMNPNTGQIPMSYYSKDVMEDDESIEKNLNKYNSNCGSLKKVKTASFEKTILKTSPEVTPAEHNVNRSPQNCNQSSEISHSRDSSTEHSAPYYYSDLSSQEHVDMMSTPHYSKSNNLNKKLNNQRMCKGPASRKNEIMHIHNPIHSNLVTNQLHGLNDESFNIAAAARSVSVEFLSAADKTAEIDVRNIYKSDTIRIQKIKDSSSSLHNVSQNSKNIYPHVTDGVEGTESNQSFDFSFNDSKTSSVRNESLHSKSESPITSVSQVAHAHNDLSTPCNSNRLNLNYALEEVTHSPKQAQETERERQSAIHCEADDLWDEDGLWRENLRRASQRHARSMDNLGCLPDSEHVSGRFSVDLKSMERSKKTIESVKSKSVKIHRTVTYVNDDSAKAEISKRKFFENKVARVQSENKQDDDDVYVQLVSKEFTTGLVHDLPDEGVYERLEMQSTCKMESSTNVPSPIEARCISKSILETRAPNKVKSADGIRPSEGQKKRFEIDREKLRQWDLMSSGLMKNEWYKVGGVGGVSGSSFANPSQMDLGGLADDRSCTSYGALMDNKCDVDHRGHADQAGCMGDIGREATLTGTEASTSASGHYQLQAANKKSLGGSNPSLSRPARDTIPIRAVSPRVRWASEKPTQGQGQDDIWNRRRDTCGVGVGVGGACALLGRSHGELQELLRELRGRHAAHATDAHRTTQQMRHLQSVLDTPEFLENRQEKMEQLEKLKLHLVELERQYSASRPLMQLVDSMVRLGALYPRTAAPLAPPAPLADAPFAPLTHLDRLERNTHARHQLLLDQAQEQRRLAESAENLSQEQIQRKMEQLWALNRELSSETGTLQELKADKEAIEKVLGGVRDKMEWRESESESDLAQVYSMLAHNSKKLEQTVGDNARLERELAALRDSLQGHTTHRTTALLEDELLRVRQLVRELQKQRQELSQAVRRLTHSAHLVSGTPAAPRQSRDAQQPLYVDTRSADPDLHSVLSPTTSDDGTHNGFGNLTNVEKQEIKTVRIVKRESERRHRDRSLQPSQSLHPADFSLPANHASLPPPSYPHAHHKLYNPSLARDNAHAPSPMGLSLHNNRTQPPSHLSLSNVNVPQNMASMWHYDNAKYGSSPTLPVGNTDASWFDGSQMSQSRNEHLPVSSRRADVPEAARISTSYGDGGSHRNRTSASSVTASLSGSVASLSSSVSALSPPAFSSEAARQIMSEVRAPAVRRAVPRERRRHHTAPLVITTDALQGSSNGDAVNYNQKKGSGRWLDDTDMERALRGTGRDVTGVTERDRPDVVRCTAPPAAKLIDTALIDQLLFAPRKILIPERYIPEKPPELSHEEQQKRLEKVESIKKMLSSGTASSTDPAKQSPGGDDKKQRQHLLHMNQILAQQVMEMSKIVAVKALQNIPLDESCSSDSEDRSPDVELPVYQQRDNFFT